MWLSLPFVVAEFVATVLLLAHQSTATFANIPDSLSSWLDSHPVPTQRATTRITSTNRTLSAATINAQRSRCPASCDEAGLSSNNWTLYHNTNRLELCNQTMLLDFTLYNSLDDPSSQISVRSCAASFSADASNVGSTTSETCPSKGNRTQIQEPMQIAFNQTGSSGSLDDFTAATQQLQRYLAQQEPSCNNATIAFAYSGSAVVGIFAGSGTQNISANVLQQFISEVQSVGISESVLVQLCAAPERNRSSRYSLGIIVNTNTNLAFVQEVVQTWASGSCVTSYSSSDTWQNVTLSVPSFQSNATFLHSNTTLSNGTSSLSHLTRALAPRAATADCTTVQVVSGDTCASLAAECGITAAEFTDYNPSSTLCSTLAAGEHVCCSAGSLPDYAPSPYANGTCYTYLVVSGDTCSALAATYSLTVGDITDWNNNTWGWMGCDDLQAGDNICLSSGYPPMPAPIANAVCGPQVPGTITVPAGTNFSTLNQCPLNACCDIWGQCGTTAEFCTITESPTGAPGTAAAGTNGCISNCGTNIITGDDPAEYLNIAFFEGFNTDRTCLNEPITALDLSPYTHVVMAFAAITPEFGIDVSEIQSSFDEFINLEGNFKKIISIGGWSFSTDPSTYMIYREAVTEANWDTFASNIVSFLAEYNLDGVNLDWEYPGEPDIPGIPAGSIYDGVNYALFLDTLVAKMASGTEVSICAPASFWYLQGFLIQSMAEFLDYVIYMTYDLHGQWDYGNIFSDPGCDPSGCLRSDVNLTETINAVSMLTKAGVPSNQIVMGVTSYGRSFQMAAASCYTEECLFTGPDSGAYAGLCTQTAGYIANAEINGIIDGNGSVMTAEGDILAVTGTPITYLDDSYSNIVVYDDTQWIGYMDDDNKAVRRSLYQALTLGGTTDWAIDLQNYTGDIGSSTETIISVGPSIWTDTNPSISCEPPCIFVLPPFPLPAGVTQTVSWPILSTTLLSLSAGSVTVTVTTTISVPVFTITDISLQPITLSGTDTSTYEVNPVQSIMPPSFIWTLGPNEATFPPSAIPTPSVSVDVGQAGGGGGGGDGTSSVASATVVGGGVVVTFFPTPVPVTIQPQPTYSITIPPTTMKPIPPVTISTGTPTSTSCTGSGCGSRDCGIFGCWPDCGFFGCDGGCNIFGCGGGCGPFGCIGGCPLDICGGLDCLAGTCGYGEGSDPENEDCDDPETVSACTFIVSSTSTAPGEYSTTTMTHCATYVACSTEDTVTTTTETTSEPLPSASVTVSLWDIAASTGAADNAIVLSLASSIRSQRSAWDATRYSGLTVPTSTSTITISSSSTSPTTSSTTTVVTPTAECYFWDAGLYYLFEIFNIEDWATADGDELHTQEDGCGAVTGWDWTDATSTEDAYVYFNIDFFIKAGCIERAIVSAGGPKLSCQGQGDVLKLKGRSDDEADDEGGPGIPPTYSEEETEAFQSYYAGLNETYIPYTTMSWATAAGATSVAQRRIKMVYVYVYVDS